MKKLIIVSILTITGTFVNISLSYAQDKIAYNYDNAGNRLGRTIIMLQGNKARAKNDIQKVNSISYMDIIDATTITIYPNPTQGFLKIDLDNMPEGENTNICIYDMKGKMLLQKSNIENSTQVNISNQSTGTYLLKINVSGKTTTWKIIKQ